MSRILNVTSAVLLSSCGALPDYVTQTASYPFTLSEEVNPRVDLLFVVDNSGSMDGNQGILSNSMEDFINAFSEKNLEFHIGIISTDQYCNPEIHSSLPSAGTCNNHWSSSQAPYMGIFNSKHSTLLSKTNGEKFISWETSDYINKFKANTLLGTLGSGSEMPLLSAINSLSAPLLTGWNSNFIRSDSFLSVILVSDEDETAMSGSQAYLYNASDLAPITARVDRLIDAAKNIRGADLDKFRFDVIARNPSEASCTGNAERARGLLFAVERINTLYPAESVGGEKAKFSSICSNFAQNISDIGEDIIRLNSRITLPQIPSDPDAIYVTVDGNPLDRSSLDGWEYLSEGNVIEFYGASTPSAGQAIQIFFVPDNPL